MKHTTLKIASALCACAGLILGIVGTGNAATMASKTLTFPTNGNTISTGPIDSSVNYTNEFKINSFDLDNAKTAHYSDREVAEMYKISELAGEPFSEVIAQVKDGMTFVYLADKYDLNYRKVQEVKAEEEIITQFRAAEAASRQGSTKRPNVLDKPGSPGSRSFVLTPSTNKNM